MRESFFPLKRLMLGEVMACSWAGVVGRLNECVGREVCVAGKHQLSYFSTQLLVTLAEIMWKQRTSGVTVDQDQIDTMMKSLCGKSVI